MQRSADISEVATCDGVAVTAQAGSEDATGDSTGQPGTRRQVLSVRDLTKGFGHGIDKPKEQLAALWHNWQWFGRHVWGEDIRIPGEDEAEGGPTRSGGGGCRRRAEVLTGVGVAPCGDARRRLATVGPPTEGRAAAGPDGPDHRASSAARSSSSPRTPSSLAATVPSAPMTNVYGSERRPQAFVQSAG